MATEILLTSEEKVKELTDLNDNIHGKYIRPAILQSQERKLKRVLGESLFNRLKEDVANRTIGGKYKELLDIYIQPYLAHCVAVELVEMLSSKVSNLGVVKSTDEKTTPVSFQEIIHKRDYYNNKADGDLYEMQMYILDNLASFPEINENKAHAIKANIYSSASCGIWLGGVRGKGTGFNLKDYKDR